MESWISCSKINRKLATTRPQSLQETARERGIDSWVLASCARLQSPLLGLLARRPFTPRDSRPGGHLSITADGSEHASGKCSIKNRSCKDFQAYARYQWHHLGVRLCVPYSEKECQLIRPSRHHCCLGLLPGCSLRSFRSLLRPSSVFNDDNVWERKRIVLLGSLIAKFRTSTNGHRPPKKTINIVK